MAAAAEGGGSGEDRGPPRRPLAVPSPSPCRRAVAAAAERGVLAGKLVRGAGGGGARAGAAGAGSRGWASSPRPGPLQNFLQRSPERRMDIYGPGPWSPPGDRCSRAGGWGTRPWRSGSTEVSSSSPGWPTSPLGVCASARRGGEVPFVLPLGGRVG